VEGWEPVVSCGRVCCVRWWGGRVGRLKERQKESELKCLCIESPAPSSVSIKGIYNTHSYRI
jgi:hypothetical protein